MAGPSDGEVLSMVRRESGTVEFTLFETLATYEASPQGRCAVQIHLSQLLPANQQPTYIRIAQRVFDNLVASYDAQLLTLNNNDMMLLCRNVRVNEIDATLTKLRGLFRADPLMQRKDIAGEDAFCTWYDLEEDFPFYKEAVIRGVIASKHKMIESQRSGTMRGGRSIDPQNLDAIARNFARLDAGELIKEQSALLIGGNAATEVLFNENFISISDMRRVVAPGIDLVANKWLFQHLTQILDLRVLALFRNNDFELQEKPISLNLNISTIMSTDFQQFDARVGANTDKVVIEFQTVDIFSDMGAYIFTRDWLRERGYKVLIDGLRPHFLEFFDPSLLDADFYKVTWAREFSENAAPEILEEVREMVKAIGRERVILSLVDSENAVKFGLSLGVQRFQGFLVDTIIQRMAAKLAKQGKG